MRRIYWPKKWKASATGYRYNGPRARFDHHQRPGPFPAAGTDPDRGIFYAAPTFECCLLECFGDRYVIDTTGARLAVLETTSSLALLDLRGRGAIAAGTLAAINQDGDRRITQDWARWWYENAELDDVHGLLFAGAHDAEDALAIFERAGSNFEPVFDAPLNSTSVLPELIVAADRLGLPIVNF